MLIVVAIVIALVSLSALGFLVSMQSENRMAHLQADSQQVDHVLASGVALLKEVAALPRAERQAWGGLQQNPALFRDLRVDLDTLGGRHGRFSVLTPSYADDSPIPVFTFGASDCSSRLSLPTLLSWDKQFPGSARQALMNLPGMTEAVADSLLDWIDADDEPREFGAEAEFYLGLQPARTPPNMPPPSIDYLLAVRGITAYQLLGEQEGPHRVQVPEQGAYGVSITERSPLPMETGVTTPSMGDTMMTPAPPWSHYLTTYSAERNVDAQGGPRIQLNGELPELHRQLSQQFDQKLADFVVAWRQFGPGSGSAADATDDPIPSINPRRPARFEFRSALDLVDATVIPRRRRGRARNSSDSQPPAYASPFQSDDSSVMENFIAFCDRTTTDPQPIRYGAINVMSAPAAVLQGIPGLTPEQIEQILSVRQDAGANPTHFAHPAWLLVDGVVEREQMTQMWDFVGVGGDVLEGQIVACYDAQSPWARCQVVVDGTTNECLTLYYRDLRRLGRGFAFTDLIRAEDAALTPTSDADTAISTRLTPAADRPPSPALP